MLNQSHTFKNQKKLIEIWFPTSCEKQKWLSVDEQLLPFSLGRLQSSGQWSPLLPVASPPTCWPHLHHLPGTVDICACKLWATAKAFIHHLAPAPWHSVVGSYSPYSTEAILAKVTDDHYNLNLTHFQMPACFTSKQHLHLLATPFQRLSRLHLWASPAGSPFPSLWVLPSHPPLQALLTFICQCFSELALSLLISPHYPSRVTSNML